MKIGVRKLVKIKLFLKVLAWMLIVTWFALSISKGVIVVKKDLEEIKALQIIQLVYSKKFDEVL